MPMNDLFPKWFKDDAGACEFAAMLWSAIQEWDDLEDEGSTINHNALLSWLAFGKEYHEYFMRNGHILRPTLLVMYLQWRAANALDRGDRDDVSKAYMLRAGIYSVYHVMAWLAGGDDWAAEMGPEIYRSYGETVESLWTEFNDAKPHDWNDRRESGRDASANISG